MHGRHPHLSSSSPLSPSNRRTRLHKDTQSRSSAHMESKQACCPSPHLFVVRTAPARRLLVSPAACSPLAAITRSGYAHICSCSGTTPPLPSLRDYAAAAIARDSAATAIARGSATAAIARGSAAVFAWKGEILPRPRSCPPSLENPWPRAPSPLPPRGGDEGAAARRQGGGGREARKKVKSWFLGLG
ncbi:hypothetical protein VitviT2T_021436 [Vitis vinifera]|uniref:Uncharacterized protein n=1 Tax=Vitis vinifera TaxID=29760 RepID=A0ABY9D700_VITVI|nr:hypothetical protein VitviT2T_021436 [Vitis vinifera]